MNENLKTTIVQKLEDMADETGRQLLDYIEFLESKFNRSTRERSTLERIAENVEGTLRSSKIGEAAVKGTGGIIDAAGNVARTMAAAGQAVMDEFEKAVTDDPSETDEPENAGEEGEAEEGVKKPKPAAGSSEADDETTGKDEAGDSEKSA